MENNKILKSLIILVAVVVIIESVVIIGRLGQGKDVVFFKQTATESVTPVAEKSADLFLSTASEVWTKGKTAKLDVNLMPKKNLAVDAIDLFVKYDPAKVDVTKLTFGDLKPTLNKIKKESGLVIVNFLINDKGGAKFNADELAKLVTIDAVPKVSGEIMFEVATGKSADGSVTMIIENETSDEIPFSANGLTVKVN